MWTLFTIFSDILQCFDTVGWVIWPAKTVHEMTYNVFNGTLNPTHFTSLQRRKVWLTPTATCRAVTLPRRETSWNLVVCPKLTKRSQPLVGRSSPYCGDIWRTLLLNKFFSDRRYVPQLRRYSPIKLCDGAQTAIFGDFLRPVFSASRLHHISDLHSKFTLGPHHVWKYGRHPISDRWD